MQTSRDIFSPANFTATRLPLSQASGLPGFCYTRADWYEREVEQILFKEWICVGRTEQIEKPGDYFTERVAGEPVLVVRDERNVIRAHLAICRHRGTELVSGTGNRKAFSCPYHSWTYGLDGCLRATPGNPKPMETAENFRKEDNGLIPLKAETWGGFIFINFDPDSKPLLTHLGELPERFGNHRLEEMRHGRRWDLEGPFNWKMYIENAREGYHLPTVHRSLWHADQPVPQWSPVATKGNYLAMYSNGALWSPKKRVLPEIEGLSEKEREGTYALTIFPTLLLNLMPTHIAYVRLFPDGAERTRISIQVCFLKSTLDRHDFEQLAAPIYAAVDAFQPQDMDIGPVAQRGLRSRFYDGGRYSPVGEPLVHDIANYVLDRVVGGAQSVRAK